MRRTAVLVGVLALAVLVGTVLRDRLGYEPSAEWLRAWTGGFGLWGPVVYTGLLAVRHFLLLPSTLMLTLGGAAFGFSLGTATGAVGLLASALVSLWLFRFVKPRRLVERMEERAGRGAAIAERSTPLALFVVTAVPPLPQTPLYWFASLTRIRMGRFAAVVGPAGAVRAGVLSLLGAGLIEANATWVAIAGAALLAGLAGAWSSPRLRALVWPAPAE